MLLCQGPALLDPTDVVHCELRHSHLLVVCSAALESFFRLDAQLLIETALVHRFPCSMGIEKGECGKGQLYSIVRTYTSLFLMSSTFITFLAVTPKENFLFSCKRITLHLFIYIKKP